MSASVLAALSGLTAVTVVLPRRARSIKIVLSKRGVLSLGLSCLGVFFIAALFAEYLKLMYLVFAVGFSVVLLMGVCRSSVSGSIALSFSIGYLLCCIFYLVFIHTGFSLRLSTLTLSMVFAIVVVLFIVRIFSRKEFATKINVEDFLLVAFLAIAVYIIFTLYPRVVLVKYFPARKYWGLTASFIRSGSVPLGFTLYYLFRELAFFSSSDLLTMETSLVIISLSSIFAIYFLSKKIMGSKAAFSVFLFALSSGLGWIYVLKEYGLSELTKGTILSSFEVTLMDIGQGVSTFTWICFTPISVGLLLACCALALIIFSENTKENVVGALCYLGLFFTCIDVALALSLFFGLFALTGFYRRKAMLSTVIVELLVLTTFILYEVSAAVVVGIIVASLLLKSLRLVVRDSKGRRVECFFSLFLAATLCASLVSFYEWIYRGGTWPTESYLAGEVVPVSYYLVVMGILFFLGVLTFSLKEFGFIQLEDSVYSVLVCLAFSSIVVGKVFAGVNSFMDCTFLSERRVLELAFLAFALSSTYLLYSAKRTLRVLFRRKGEVAAAILVFSITMASLYSTVFTVRFWRTLSKLDDCVLKVEDIGGLHNLTALLDDLKTSRVLVFSQNSCYLVESIAEPYDYTLVPWSFARCVYFPEFSYTMSCWKGKYLVLSKSDYDFICRKYKWSYLYQCVSSEDNLVFKDSAWRVYLLKAYTLPSLFSRTAVVFWPSVGLRRVSFVLEVFSKEEINYTLVLPDDFLTIDSADTVILLNDPADLSFSISGKSLVIVINLKGYGFFANNYGCLLAERNRVYSIYFAKGLEIPVNKSVYVKRLYFFNSTPIAYYIRKEESIAGIFACMFQLNGTRVLYINAYPLIRAGAYDELKCCLTEILESIVKLNRVKRDYCLKRVFLSSGILLKGDVCIKCKSVIFKNVPLTIYYADEVKIVSEQAYVKGELWMYTRIVAKAPVIIIKNGVFEYSDRIWCEKSAAIVLNQSVVFYARRPIIECKGYCMLRDYMYFGPESLEYGLPYRHSGVASVNGYVRMRVLLSTWSLQIIDVFEYSGVLMLDSRARVLFGDWNSFINVFIFLLLLVVIYLSINVIKERYSVKKGE